MYRKVDKNNLIEVADSEVPPMVLSAEEDEKAELAKEIQEHTERLSNL
jgi:hypothetical protein